MIAASRSAAVPGGIETAVDLITLKHPDVVVLDNPFPPSRGSTWIQQIMESAALPLIVCTHDAGPAETSFVVDARESGALSVVHVPHLGDNGAGGEIDRELIQTVVLMADVKVVRRRPHAGGNGESMKPDPLLPTPNSLSGART